jgi:hypothetical protein
VAHVIKAFKDKHTGERFKPGMEYEGKNERLAELAGLGYVLYDGNSKLEAPKWPKHVGGGTFELSNGDKVKGKDEASAAQTALDNKE